MSHACTATTCDCTSNGYLYNGTIRELNLGGYPLITDEIGSASTLVQERDKLIGDSFVQTGNRGEKIT